ncbi:MAG: TraC family protein [Bdellovibrionaceae bacterium]|jgi:type-IV secretion system protein TraC|nr:TraC family protein [Pseudobdellovibrionaceae bacterium]
MSAVLADKLQVWGMEDDFIIYSDGSLGFCLETLPIDVSCWDEYALNDFHDKLCQLLNALPINIDVQFIQSICSGNAQTLLDNETLCKASKNEKIQKLSLKRVSHLQNIDKSGYLPVHKLKILVRKKLTKSLMNKTSIFSGTQLFNEMSEANLKTELKKCARIKDDLMGVLNNLGLNTRQIKAQDIVEELYMQWNPVRDEELKSYDPSDIRNSILFTDTVIAEDSFSLGKMNYKVISLKILPSQTFATMASVLRTLPFNSKLFLSINVSDQTKEIESLQTQRRVAFSMVYGKQSGVSDIESEAKLNDLEGLVEELIAQGEKVFHFGLNVLLRSTSKDALDDQVSQTLMTLRDLGGSEGMEETIAAFDIYSQFAFPNTRVAERTKRIKTSNLADLLPVYGPWVGHKEAKILLRSRMGSLVKFNPFSNSLTNANQIVSGGSGSGKSFLTNLLLIQMLKEDPLVFVVDIGGSYKKVCDNLSGQYIPLGLDSNLAINPFDLAPGETQPSSEKIKFLLALIESMTKEEADSGLKKLERSEIEEAIQQVYESSPCPTLSDLKAKLIDHPNIEIKRIGRILNAWCGNTPYGQFLDRPTNVDFNKSVVCFDLKGLESYPDLQKSCLLIISDLVLRTVQKDRSRMKFLVFDECWALLEGEGASFIGSIFRTCRKYFMSCIAISQNIDDFARSSVSAAIMTNSSIKWILRQKGADKSRLKEVLELNDTEVALISSLHQEKGVYSEAFLMCEDQKSVVAIESTPEEYWLATTDPKDLSLMDEVQDKYPELDAMELIFRLAVDYPQGAVDY